MPGAIFLGNILPKPSEIMLLVLIVLPTDRTAKDFHRTKSLDFLKEHQQLVVIKKFKKLGKMLSN